MKLVLTREFPSLVSTPGHTAVLHVEYTYDPGHPGTWYRSNGDPGDPPEPACVDIEDAFLHIKHGPRTVAKIDLWALADELRLDTEPILERLTEWCEEDSIEKCNEGPEPEPQDYSI